jgi:tRNA-dihydrouridine synthase A
MIDRRVSIAPMMDWTDRHDRYFLRLIAPHVLLYTEMVTTGALIYGDKERFLAFDKAEHPIALQLGGHKPDELALCARMGEDHGYDEINLNVGCPSDRVKSGRFGACLMLTPDVVAEGIAAMQNAVKVPVTVKCRIGVDNEDSYEALQRFITHVNAAGCDTFIVHARKAWLNGLSPKQNREIPPLRYDVVRQLKQDFPTLTIVVNGGISTASQVKEHLLHVDGVMIGREAYTNPYFLTELEKNIFSMDENISTRLEVMKKFMPYIEQQLRNNVKLSSMTRHILGLFQGEVGARRFRRHLSENAFKPDATVNVVKDAIAHIETNG